jgi:hypothetical protein
MIRSQPGSQIGLLQCRWNPVQVLVGGEQRVESVDPVDIRSAVWLTQQLQHRYGGSHCVRSWRFEPVEDSICQFYVPWVLLDMEYENAGVDRHCSMASEESLKFLFAYVQLPLSFFR